MKNSIENILTTYGFQTDRPGCLAWGVGSLVWGHLMYVTTKGEDLYEVEYHTWYYDSNGDEVYDTTETATLYGAKVIEFAFTHLPTNYLTLRAGR